MNFNSQICTTKEQSNRLLALGLKKETANMYYPMETESEQLPIISDKNFGCPKNTIPAWSLHRLIEMMPITIEDSYGISYYSMIEEKKDVSFIYFGEENWAYFRCWSKDNLYDNLIDCIEWIIGEGYFNKEYLKINTK